MQNAPTVIGHHAAAAIYVETAAYHYTRAVERLGAAAPWEAAYHAQVACDNIVFAAHHMGEDGRSPTTHPGVTGAAAP